MPVSYFKKVADFYHGQPLIIFDRDGTLNVDRNGYTHQIEDFELHDDVLEALNQLSMQNFNIAIATNQSGVSKGLYNIENFERFNELMLEVFRKNKIVVNCISACFHDHNELCNCRKPKPGMLQYIINQVKPNNFVYFVGDKDSDVDAARAANIVGVKVTNNNLLTLIKRIVEEID